MLTQYEAMGIAEGWVENPGKTQDEKREVSIKAWQLLIDTGLVWKLQGWFGRAATRLIEDGICTEAKGASSG
jgi:hypothetical protein